MIHKIGEYTGHSGAIYDLAVSENYVFSASADGYLVRWNLSDFSQDNFVVKCSAPPYSLSELNGFLWFGLSSGDLHVVHLKEKREVKFFQQHRSAIFSVRSIPQKNLILVADADGNLSVWDNERLDLVLFLPLKCGKIRKLNIHPSGDYLVVHGQDGMLRIFETDHFNEIHTFFAHENGATCSVFSPTDPNMLISGGKDGHLKQWDWSHEKLLKSIPAHNFAIYDVAVLSDKKTLISCSRDKSIKIWNLPNLQFQEKIEAKTGGHKHSVNALCLLDDNQFLSSSDDKRIIKWKMS